MTYLKVFTDFRELMEPLGHAEKGRLFEAMLSYALDGTEPVLEGNERFIWPVARREIDREAEAYESKVAAARTAGKRSGEARRRAKTVEQTETKGNEDERQGTNVNETNQEQEKDQEKDKDKDQEKDQDQEKEQENDQDHSKEYVCMPKENAQARADTHTREREERDLPLKTAAPGRVYDGGG